MIIDPWSQDISSHIFSLLDKQPRFMPHIEEATMENY